jgi:hypothetical protein
MIGRAEPAARRDLADDAPEPVDNDCRGQEGRPHDVEWSALGEYFG